MKARLPLQTNDADLLNEFVNSFETRTRVLTMMKNGNYDVALKTATELIEILKKEYHLR